VLDLVDVRVHYGKVAAVRGVSLRVACGEVVAIVGPNGAGKSTLLRAVSGLVRPSAGTLAFEGHDLTRLRPHQIVRLGITQSPEGRRIFAQMTVVENLRVGGFTRGAGAACVSAMDRVFARFPWLEERRHQKAGTLSGGEQQMLSIGRALMSEPRLLLLDEPSFGLAPLIVKEIAGIVAELSRPGDLAIVLVEQNASMALAVSDRAYVIENGEVVASGLSPEVAESRQVREAYLGRRR
jgi:branched-chain amino acid transport system ATP-binding protein